MGDCLASGQENLSHHLLGWADRFLLQQVDQKKAPYFEAAIISFLLACKDSSLDLGGSGASSRKKKALAHVDSKNLVRKVCEMRSWYSIWQTSQLYVYTDGGAPDENNNSHSRLPPTALWELRKIVTEALIECEKEVLMELDELSPDEAQILSLPLWACIWQMIFIYRQLFAGYSKLNHKQAGSGHTEKPGE